MKVSLYDYTNFVIFTLVATRVKCNAARDCEVGSWGLWAQCSMKCDVGNSSRKRNITQQPWGIFSKGCPELIENRECGEIKNGCQEACQRSSGKCLCYSGFTLGSDQKSCVDVNECAPNEGKGPCSHACKNLSGGYKCSCLQGLYLQVDGHKCSPIKPIRAKCKPGIHVYDENQRCICNNKLLGPRCDRDIQQCSNKKYICKEDEMCAKFTKVQNKCVPINAQVSTLLKVTSEQYITGLYRYNLESYLEALLDGETNGNTLNTWYDDFSGNKQQDTFYVESLSSIRVSDQFTLVTFVVSDVKNNYLPVDTWKVCNMLQGTDVACVSDKNCKIISNNGIDCPKIYKIVANNQNSDKSDFKTWMYGAIIGSIIVFVIFILTIMYIRKRRKSNYKNIQYESALIDTDYQLPSSQEQPNILYGHQDSITGPLYESIDNLKVCKDEDEYVEMSMSSNHVKYIENPQMDGIDGNNKKELLVDMPELPECRYTSPPKMI